MLVTLGVILGVCALFLIVAVLMQQGKGKSLGSAISGSSNSDTFYGKTKSSDKKLSTATAIIAIIFVVLVLVVYIVQDSVSAPSFGDAVTGEGVTTTEHDHDHDAETTEAVDTTAALTEETTPAA